MSQQDPAITFILDRIGEVSRRLEDALRMLERRTEQTAAMREQLANAQKDIEAIFRILHGDGTESAGLQHRYHDIKQRLHSIEEALDELDGTARLSRLEEGFVGLSENVKGLLATRRDVSVEDVKGHWSMNAAGRAGKYAIATAIATGVAGFLWQLIKLIAQALKP